MEVVLIIVGVAVLILSLFFIIFIDAKLIFWYLFKKKTFKRRMIRQYKKSNITLTYLGTLHHMHYTFKEYNFLHIKAILENMKPDLLLIESRQEEINKGNLADGPIEMVYTHLRAKQLGIPVKGIDYFNETTGKPGSTNKPRDLMMFNKLTSELDGYHNVLVIVGATHMLMHKRMLKNHGFKRYKLSKSLMDDYFTYPQDEVFAFPKALPELIQTRIKHEQAYLKTYKTEPWQKAGKRIITNLEQLLDKIDKEEILIKDE